MGVFMKFIYAFLVHFIIYWVFIQPFIGKDFSYSKAVSYSVGAIILIISSALANLWMLVALIIGNQATENGVHYVLINMVLADLMQTFIVTPLTISQKITPFLQNNGIGMLDMLIRRERLIGQFTLLAGLLYAASIIQYCFLSFLRTWYRLQHVALKTTMLSLQVAWMYTALCFTFDGKYWYGQEWAFSSTMYAGIVEIFVPLALSVVLIVAMVILQYRRSPESRADQQEADGANKLMYALVIVFAVFRAPLMIVRLAQEQELSTSSYKIKKMKMIAANLYGLKYCINPLLVYVFDKNGAMMYGKLREIVSLRCGYDEGHGNEEGGESSRVTYESSNQNINIGLTMDEEAELLP